MNLSDRDRAIDRSLTRQGGQPRLICAECGAALLRRGGGAVCGKDAAHVGYMEAPSQAEYVFLARLERAHVHPERIVAELTDARRRGLSFLILREHNWGTHERCRLLPALGVNIVCAAAPPRPRPIENLWGKDKEDA